MQGYKQIIHAAYLMETHIPHRNDVDLKTYNELLIEIVYGMRERICKDDEEQRYMLESCCFICTRE